MAIAESETTLVIRVDAEDAARQIGEELQKVIDEVAMSMRRAADALDNSRWWREHEAYMESERSKAFQEGRLDG